MHRAISGDLQNEEEMDKAMQEGGEEDIFHVRIMHIEKTALRQNAAESLMLFEL